tara:strand:+ start:1384 stop:1503 length:120 start_codon:yes stop_codon:yes gene_type:complete
MQANIQAPKNIKISPTIGLILGVVGVVVVGILIYRATAS